jgi:glycosyltransferase involved in cell wall biosynthesis
MKLFWLSKIGSKDSFSRIGENILPYLKNEHDITLYTNVPKKLENVIKEDTLKNLFEDYIIIGDHIKNANKILYKTENDLVTYTDFYQSPQNQDIQDNQLYMMMKYTLFQTIDFCIKNKIDIILITMGVFEANLLMGMYGVIKEYMDNLPKIIIYTPFDYVPSIEAVDNYKHATKVITTLPIVNIANFGIEMGIIGHANDKIFKYYGNKARKVIIDLINKSDFFNSNPKIKYDDIIILNANVYNPRKRIEKTIEVFNQLIKKFPDKPLKLWLNNDSDSSPVNIDLLPKNRIIRTSGVSNRNLNLIYNICQIGLQTSWGEGWSLTNCEHSICGGIQVVPNWLATGYHFADNRGIMYSVSHSLGRNEENKSIIIGIPNDNDIITSLESAIGKLDVRDEYCNRCIEYFSRYSWKEESANLNKIIDLL